MKASFFAMLFLLLTSSAWAAALDDLTLVTEEYPPLSYTEDGLHRGIASDLLIEMLAATGSLKSHQDIASLPWARGYQMALKRKNIMLFSMTRSSSREALFQWVGPILKSKIVLLAHKDRKLKLDDLSEIEKNQLKVGVVLDDIGQQLLETQQVSGRRVYPYNQGRDMVRMLAEGRIDLIAYDVLVSRWNLRQLGYQPDDFKIVYTLQPADYYYAISRKTDPELAAILQQQLERLRKLGRIKSIIARYLN